MLEISQLIVKIKKNSPHCDTKKIESAFNFAKEYHKSQRRRTGEPYIQHPLAVTFSLADFKFSTDTYVAALLHDCVEDAKLDINTIKSEFGDDVAKLVSGVTKLSKIKFRKHIDIYPIENLRKMFLAMAQDLRVILIKLFDRLHNLKTLDGLTFEQQKRIARETIEIYAPLAYRLGIGELKGQLEDLAFRYHLPREYKWTKELALEETEKRAAYIESAKSQLERVLNKEKINFINIHGRAKHLFSLYKKLKKNKNDINSIYDLLALRVIVKDVPDCYRALGAIHQEWKPLLGRIKDFIAVPKTNGYQSLHTTCITPDGKIIEVQIRTKRMHEEAEYGLAASWYYQEADKPKEGKQVPEKLSWINQLIEWQKEIKDSYKFAESLKIDFFTDRIFVFTPNGDVLDLPESSTPIDFAYQIHSDVGDHCQGAIVNNKLVSLDNKLKNGDVVRILTNKAAAPKRDWLSMVKTHQAKNKIRAWFKKIDAQTNLEDGRNLLNAELLRLKNTSLRKIPKNKIKSALEKFSYKSLDDLAIAIGQGDVGVRQVIKKLYKEEELFAPRHRKFFFFGKPVLSPRAIIESEEGLLTNLAKCCHPVLGDKIKAFVTRSKGASIHKTTCRELKKLTKSATGRILKARWNTECQPYCLSNIELQTLDRVGLLRDVSDLLADLGVNIISLKTSRQFKNNDIVNLNLSLEVRDVDQLIFLLGKLEKIKGVLGVVRK